MNLFDYLQLFMKKRTLIEVFDINTQESLFQGEINECLKVCNTGIANVMSVDLSKNKMNIYVEEIPNVN